MLATVWMALVRWMAHMSSSTAANRISAGKPSCCWLMGILKISSIPMSCIWRSSSGSWGKKSSSVPRLRWRHCRKKWSVLPPSSAAPARGMISPAGKPPLRPFLHCMRPGKSRYAMTGYLRRWAPMPRHTRKWRPFRAISGA